MIDVPIGFAVGSIEGRVAVEYFDPSPEAQVKKYAFKCHRKAVDGVDHVWAVNSLAFHPVYVHFLLAGFLNYVTYPVRLAHVIPF